MIKELNSYKNKHVGRNFVIVGAGATLREYITPIRCFCADKNCVTIGINKMTAHIVPTYHLWTNNQRLRDQNDCISSDSELMLGCNIREPLRSRFSDYIGVNYVSAPGLKYSFGDDGVIIGHYRVAGTLAIAIADIMGAKNIYVVGMDGFTLHSHSDLNEKRGDQHCYGMGFTDDATYKECVVKDKLTFGGLHMLKESGVNFKIITPTVHTEFFENILGLDK